MCKVYTDVCIHVSDEMVVCMHCTYSYCTCGGKYIYESFSSVCYYFLLFFLNTKNPLSHLKELYKTRIDKIYNSCMS